MSEISPTLEGFRAAFRRPLVTLAEITWRWTAGATAAALFFFGLFEYLNTLPVTNGELLFLRTRQPYLVGEAIAHILRGSLNRVVISALLATLLLMLVWIVAASVGRVATVRGLLDHFRSRAVRLASIADGAEEDEGNTSGYEVVEHSPLPALFRLNFLRAAIALAAALGFVGAWIAGTWIAAGFVSSDINPRPGLAFFLFLPLAAMIWLAWWSLNWFLSLSGMLAVRDGEDAVGSIAAAVAFCRERTGRVWAVSIWTGLAHLVAFVAAVTVVSMPTGFIAIVPGRLIVAIMMLVTLIYFAVADWIYIARLAGYVCIAEMPEPPLAPLPMPSPAGPRVQTTIDRDEPILSDVPQPAIG